MVTPRHVIDWVCKEVKATDDSGPCLSMAMFHQVRTELVASRGFERGTITLNTKMEKGWFAMRSVRDEVITRVSGKAARLAKRPKQQWKRSEVREVVRQIIREQIGVQDFSDDDHFIRDLGID